MRDQLLGAIQPTLSILLDPGETVIGEASRFAWMTDSIEMTVADDAGACVYTATAEQGVVAFASQRPGRILTVDVGSWDEGYLVRRSGFMARTPGVEVQVDTAEHGLVLWRIGGSGRAWVELPGDAIRRELTAGHSLRVQPEHIGMFDSTVAIQVTQVQGISAWNSGYPCAVLSGPGVVWLQATALDPERLIGWASGEQPAAVHVDVHAVDRAVAEQERHHVHDVGHLGQPPARGPRQHVT
jgi:uncharacterized protein (AIM24 family)